MATYLEQSLAKLKEFEGCVPWMYRDTVGAVTVGVGLMLPNAEAAGRLPFLAGGRAASQTEIAAEFRRVSGAAEGRAPAFYRGGGGLVLTDLTIESKLRGALQGFEATLRARLPGYDGFPDCVKMALLDMVYNLGPAGLLVGFPKMIAAIEKGDWAQAAANCLRHGPSPARNAWTQTQLLSVVRRIEAEAEIWWKRLLWGLVGVGVSLVERAGRAGPKRSRWTKEVDLDRGDA